MNHWNPYQKNFGIDEKNYISLNILQNFEVSMHFYTVLLCFKGIFSDAQPKVDSTVPANEQLKLDHPLLCPDGKKSCCNTYAAEKSIIVNCYPLVLRTSVKCVLLHSSFISHLCLNKINDKVSQGQDQTFQLMTLTTYMLEPEGTRNPLHETEDYYFRNWSLEKSSCSRKI